MKPVTFDRFARGLVFVLSLAALSYLFCLLSPVLLPFVVSAVMAYLLNPVCGFLQHTLRLRIRVVCVVITLVLFFALLLGLMWLCVPPMIEELAHFRDVALRYIEKGTDNVTVPLAVQEFFADRLRESDWNAFLHSEDFLAMVRGVVPRVWELLRSTAGLVMSVLASLMGVLYLFFLLLDYDRYAAGWTRYVPARYHRRARRLLSDVTYYMCGYFRGQLLIAASNCVMFALGLWIVGFPMPIALGFFIGIVSFVPYLQVVGMLPATLLALLRAVETGCNFWWLIGSVVLVYIVVQILQDVLVTPRVMGRIMGLSPAVILLSLSVGGFLFGIPGLIVALPVTTLGLLYYRRYVVGDAAA